MWTDNPTRARLALADCGRSFATAGCGCSPAIACHIQSFELVGRGWNLAVADCVQILAAACHTQNLAVAGLPMDRLTTNDYTNMNPGFVCGRQTSCGIVRYQPR